MTTYRATGDQLTKLADTEVVKVGGLSLSATAAARRFTAPVLAQAGLYVEYREPDQGDGWSAPRIGTAPDGTPCALVPAIVRTAADVAIDGRRAIVARAHALQEQAAGVYAWPEAAAWVPLEEQARDWLGRTATIGVELAAAAGVAPALSGDERVLVSAVAQQTQDAYLAASTAAAEAGLPAPESGPLQSQSVTWLNTIYTLGPDLAADCGADAEVHDIQDRVVSVIAKADAFRRIVGAVKRWRRESLAKIDAAVEGDATREDLKWVVETALAIVADGALPQASG